MDRTSEAAGRSLASLILSHFSLELSLIRSLSARCGSLSVDYNAAPLLGCLGVVLCPRVQRPPPTATWLAGACSAANPTHTYEHHAPRGATPPAPRTEDIHTSHEAPQGDGGWVARNIGCFRACRLARIDRSSRSATWRILTVSRYSLSGGLQDPLRVPLAARSPGRPKGRLPDT